VKRQDGRIKFIGRVKELIKSGGMNIAPQLVEAALLSHPKTADACVVGVNDDRLGEAAVAVVRVIGPVTEEELLRWCRGRLSAYEVPRRIVITEEDLPRLGTGKIDRAVVRSHVARLPYASES
jgi:fatty-acyl-CoA synthase